MLRTERLCLRNLRLEDVGIMLAYRNDSRCCRYQRYGDSSEAGLCQLVESYAHSTLLSQEQEQHYAIARGDDGAMIGDVSVFFTEADNCFTLGLTVAPAYQRQGYAYELLCALVAQLRAQYPTVDIVALIERENTGSIALFQKLGFVEECYAESIGSYIYTLYGAPDGAGDCGET